MRVVHLGTDLYIWVKSKHSNTFNLPRLFPFTDTYKNEKDKVYLGYDNGCLIVYIDGTLRFISNSWYNDLNIEI